jgi:hypothetical protein
MSDIKKGRSADTGKYRYTYADLADTLQSVRPILARNGLAVLQTASAGADETVMISTTILHSSGEWMTASPLGLPAGQTSQETGSAISYGRRYHLLASLGLAAEDDDAATAGNRKQHDQARPPQTPQAGPGDASPAQLGKIRAMSKSLGKLPPANLDGMSKRDASALIEKLIAESQAASGEDPF